jgi:hypothetical protein
MQEALVPPEATDAERQELLEQSLAGAHLSAGPDRLSR